MKLIIVESPNKIKKIQKYVGSDYKVSASVGHFRDLPEKEMGVEPPDYIPKYVITKPDVVKKLKGQSKTASEVILATDLDREGEAIAWHLHKALGLKTSKRVVFNEITSKAIKKALSSPGVIDMKMVAAQEARRVLDRLVGYKVSRPLANSVGQKASAGRVQSLAMRMVVERELEIKNFKPTDHFGVTAHLLTDKKKWQAVWQPKLPKDQQYLTDINVAQAVVDGVKTLDVLSVQKKETRQRPYPPFTTSTLQQAASVVFKFGAKRTMDAAQKLFEGGHITYHRTDSPNLSDEAIEAVRKFLSSCGLSDYTPDKPNKWKSKADAQEAHEAIRPTDVGVKEPDDLGSEDEKKLYRLIRERTIVSQMSDAVFDVTTVSLESGEQVGGEKQKFQATGRVLKFAGWKKFDKGESENEKEGDMQALPDIKEGATLQPEKLVLDKKTTKPPPRFTEASLIKKLEKEGIGRPSTYASIMTTIFARKFVRSEKSKLIATELGMAAHESLKGKFQFYEVPFTREMEKHLDKVAKGKTKFKEVVSLLDTQLSKDLENFIATVPQKKSPVMQGEIVGKCPVCGEKVVENKKAFGCSAWKSSECKFSLWKNCFHRLGKKDLTAKQAKQLLSGKELGLKNLKSKKGNTFSAAAVLEEDPKYGWQPKLKFNN